MRLINIFAVAALPMSIFAMPAAPLDAATIETREPGFLPKRDPLSLLDLLERPTPVKRMPFDKVLLAPRQENSSTPGLGELLGGILPALRAVGTLLNAETIDNIKTTIDGLAVVLGDNRAQNTANLLDTVGGLLSSDLLKNLEGLLPAVSGLLSTDNIQLLQGILSAAGIVLTDDFARQLVGLFNDVAPLVSAISQIITTLIQAILGG